LIELEQMITVCAELILREDICMLEIDVAISPDGVDRFRLTWFSDVVCGLLQVLIEARTILTFETLLLLLSGNYGVVVFRDDASRHLAHLMQTPRTPRSQHNQRRNKNRVSRQ